ncbi:hypothetical protein D3C80_2009280 [compost metagenome]
MGVHIGKAPLRALVGSQRLGPDLALANPAQACLQGGIGDAERHGCNLDTTTVEYLHGSAEASAFVTEQR